MKKIKQKIGLLVALFVVSFSCDTEFLNTRPLDKISSDATWADGPLAEAFIFNIYSFLGYGGFEEQALAAYTDEAMFTHSGRNINTFTEGTESPNNVAWVSGTYEWGNMYLAIRQANTAIQNLPDASFDDQGLKDRLMGEAHFLRAYYYQQLLRFYGGIPIIDRPYGLDEDYSIARNTYEECVNFIVADLDKAASLLDGKSRIPGRASRLAAMALKARVLLYAASDLHDAGKAQANSSTLAGYSDIALVAYTSGDQTTRYNAAKNAAKAVLDELPGYKLDLSAPVSESEGRSNYKSIAMGGRSAIGDPAAEAELIFERTHTPLYTQEDNWPLGGIHYGINNGPNGYHNWAGNTPIQQLVDDYEMMDGSSFDWNNGEHASAPYQNRDPRFYATVLFDGADWKPRPADVAPLDPVNQIQTGFYDDGNGGVINGIDTRKSVIEDWNGTRTHYYTHKFIDADPALADNQSNAQVIPWPFIRVTEMALSYAEAAFKTGDEASAREWINKIRFRAGMPAINDSGADLWARIINERRVELAYEEHRYHDARRWMIAPETLGRGIKAIDVKATLKPGATAHSPYRYDPEVYNYTYTVVDETTNESRKWDDKMYYRVLTRDEVNRNNLLVQNPGY
ncbi:RagB/SusD family nutrient uptake outer membrane protein [Jiulongibacter sediminis]|uniref:Carbohydrate-binding protein SusD n=1 Tax=Jiulongibacter sediminis TaxID=1605367 RepID=A0A0N8HA42_9BACT|nr:RagB/SusD family nutrient uptake outer membrane protein [Jiulongibacter sediminis]KPM49124.1 carbohydrate-binding protein SusD [Jiulongibacter sediminis]TBX26181.1 carbohydrate-binding protein SusD [Jiulongibacter sediminis]